MDLYSQEIQQKKKDYKINPKPLRNGNRNIYINNYFKVTGLNAPTKRHRLAEWIQKQDPNMLSTRNPLQNSRHI